MDKRHAVIQRLARGQSIVLDGSMTGELTRHGFRPAGVLGDAAAAREAPDAVGAAHRAFVEAGADVLCAFTARTAVRTLARGGFGMRAAAVTGRAVDLALEVAARADRPIAVAGVLGSIEDGGDRGLSARTLADELFEQSTRLATAGCHAILIEGMPTLRETLAATSAARAAMPAVWTSLAVARRGELADGTPLDRAAQLAVATGAQAVIIDGSASRVDLVGAVATLAGLALGVPLGMRTHVDEGGDAPERFATDLGQAMQRGARLLGGTRGATPDHIRALAALVRSRAAA